LNSWIGWLAIPPAAFTDAAHAATMLVIVVRLAALEPEHEQITPSLYGEPVALFVDAPLLVVLPPDVALLLHPLTTSATHARRAAAHRIGLMACLLVSNSQGPGA